MNYNFMDDLFQTPIQHTNNFNNFNNSNIDNIIKHKFQIQKNYIKHKGYKYTRFIYGRVRFEVISQIQ